MHTITLSLEVATSKSIKPRIFHTSDQNVASSVSRTINEIEAWFGVDYGMIAAGGANNMIAWGYFLRPNTGSFCARLGQVGDALESWRVVWDLRWCGARLVVVCLIINVLLDINCSRLDIVFWHIIFEWIWALLVKVCFVGGLRKVFVHFRLRSQLLDTATPLFLEGQLFFESKVLFLLFLSQLAMSFTYHILTIFARLAHFLLRRLPD